jgi:hypothetical protein
LQISFFQIRRRTKANELEWRERKERRRDDKTDHLQRTGDTNLWKRNQKHTPNLADLSVRGVTCESEVGEGEENQSLTEVAWTSNSLIELHPSGRGATILVKSISN